MVERSPNKAVELLRRPGGGLRTIPLIGNFLLHVAGRFHTAASLSSRPVSGPEVPDVGSPWGAATASYLSQQPERYRSRCLVFLQVDPGLPKLPSHRMPQTCRSISSQSSRMSAGTSGP